VPDSNQLHLSTAAPPVLRAWSDPRIVHGFLGRRGGQSKGTYDSMNLGQHVGDDPDDVATNWERLRATLPDGLVFSRSQQVHGNTVRLVSRADAEERPAADGMVTRERGVVLGIFTADCVPILMTTHGGDVACALHAGWRGVIAGIGANGVDAMEKLGARRGKIRAALGPSIGPCCFEVDADLASRFAAEVPGAARHARDGKPGKAYLDLRGIVRDQLVAAGLGDAAIENVGPCTRCASDQFFSRRAAGGVTTGLQMSFVGLVAD
jgi:YfiH family protein